MIPMKIDFIGRKKELGLLYRLRDLEPPPFLVIVGRRRVGKTRLVQEFIKDIPESSYFFVEEKKAHVLLNDFSRIVGDGIVFRDWEGYLRYTLANFDAVVIDEFQNFDRVDASFYSTLQKMLDEEKPRAMLIAVGSYVGMMKRIFTDRKSPLFGRATEIWTLPPLPVKEMIPAIKGDLGNRIAIHALFGGFPKYHVILNQYETFDLDAVLDELIARPYAPLSMEPYTILMQEFGGEYRAYFSLLEAIARGKASYVDIANYTGMSTTTLARYLNDLKAFGLIEKRFPVTEGPRSKKSRYFICDQFIRFWFRYIFSNMHLVESERYGELRSRIREDIPAFVSWEFEQIVRTILAEEYPRIGPWWNRKGDEIDVVGIDDRRKRIVFGEVKWTNRKMGFAIVRDLIDKSALVTGFERYEKIFLLVSKSGFTVRSRRFMEDEGIIFWDMTDIDDLLNGKKNVETTG